MIPGNGWPRGSFAAAVLAIAMPAQLTGQAAAGMIDYTRQVHALFAAKCLVCHSGEKRSGGLSLATYADVLNGGRSGAAVKPGNSGSSLLVHRITGSGATRMPIGGPALSATEIGIVTAWIDQGARSAPDAAAAKAKWEAPLSLDPPPVPDSPWKNWTLPLDRFAASYFAGHGVAEPVLVSDGVFARRAYLDVQGLLPPPEDLRTFLADTASDKRARLVDRLLSENQKYAEHWISYWNDLLRNDEGVNYYSETAGRKSITDWLLDALVSNKPYNQMVVKLLNPTEPNDPDGFLIGVNWRGTVSASQTPALQAAQNTAQVFLGVNLKCNSCHDSFISKWKLKDAYSLAAYFSAEEKLRLYRCDIAQEEYAEAGFLFPELSRPLASLSPAERRAAAAEIFTDPRNGRMPRTVVNRIWQRLMGRGIVELVDEMDGEPWSPELLDWLAGDFVASGYDLKRLISIILQSRTYQLAAVAHKSEPEKQFTFRGPEVRRLTAEQFSDAVAAITGDWHALPGRAAGAGRGGGRSGPIVISGTPSDGAGVNTPRAAPPVAGRGAANPNAPPAPIPIPPGTYARGWRIAGSSLERALGRPIRDQVYSTRDTQATTIQALELVNGDTLTHWLWRGARRMLGELPPEPVSLVARQANGGRGAPIPFDVDISQSDKLYLIVQDSLSTAPDKAAPLWVQPELIGPNGSTPLSALKPVESSGLRDDVSPITITGVSEKDVPAIRVKLSSVLVYDIAGKGFTRFKGAPGHEALPLSQGESVLARFFVFDQKPGMDRLVPPNPEMPLPAGPVVRTAAEAVDRVYWYALGRAPSAAERRVAEAALRDPARPSNPSADGLADLLWSVMMTPEFQLIR
jgi:mono/diheme cytochrome c family protein